MALDEAHATSGQQDTLVAVWRGEPTVQRVNVLADQLHAIALRNDGRVFLYNVITAATPIPSAAARTALQKQFARMRGQLLAAAIVLEKTGVEGALARSVLSTLVTVSQRPFPMRIFAVRRDAARWLGTLGCQLSANSMMSLADSLSLRMGTSASNGPGSVA